MCDSRICQNCQGTDTTRTADGSIIFISFEPTRYRITAIGSAGVGLAAVAIWLTMASDNVSAAPLAASGIRSMLIIAPIAVGLYAWSRRPASRFAWVLMVWGFAFFPVTINASTDPVLYTAATIYVALPFAFIFSVHLVLSYPTGLLETRAARSIAVGSIGVGAAWIAAMLFTENPPTLDFLIQCGENCPENLLFVADEPGAAEVLAAVARMGTALVTLAIAATFVYRLYHASRSMRRTLLPVAAVYIVTTVAATVLRVAENANVDANTLNRFAIAVGITRVAVPFGILAGMIAGQMFVGTALARLLRVLARHPGPSELERALAEALDDESLTIGYWLPDREIFVNGVGRPIEVSDLDSSRVLTEVKQGPTPVAAIMHDIALDDHPGMVEAAASASLLAFENTRLEAELRASIVELRSSQERIVTAADAERRRIERDLHDGVQTRLIAIRINLELLRGDDGTNPLTTTERFADLTEDLDGASDDLRRLARGIYPPVLRDRGLGDALQTVALHAPLPTQIESRSIVRYAAEVESAAYFCCLEALQNIGKHAGDGAVATVQIWDGEDELCFEIADTGIGFDPETVSQGVGLVNMRDRLGALGGELVLDSTIGSGTTVSGRIPVRDGYLEV